MHSCVDLIHTCLHFDVPILNPDLSIVSLTAVNEHNTRPIWIAEWIGDAGGGSEAWKQTGFVCNVQEQTHCYKQLYRATGI